MLDKFILYVADYITRYTQITTVYKTLLVMIGVALLLMPVIGQLPLLLVITMGVVTWLVTEYLYTVSLLDEEKNPDE